MGIDERPADSCYANFGAYLENPDTELELMPDIRYHRRGPIPPPSPPPFAISRAAPRVREPPAMSDMESYFFKRSAVDFEVASSWADLHPDGHEFRQIEEM